MCIDLYVRVRKLHRKWCYPTKIEEVSTDLKLIFATLYLVASLVVGRAGKRGQARVVAITIAAGATIVEVGSAYHSQFFRGLKQDISQ